MESNSLKSCETILTTGESTLLKINILMPNYFLDFGLVDISM